MARYSNFLKRFVRGNVVTPAASVLRAVNGDSGWLNAEDYHQLALTLDITAVGGATTLDVVVETASDDQGAHTAQVGAFAQQNGVAAVRKVFAGLDKFYRVRWTVGAASATFSVSGEAK